MIVLIKRTLRVGHVYAVADVDNPTGRALAWAFNGPDGWQVTRSGGAVVAERLDQRRALALMQRTGREVAATLTTRLLAGGIR